MSGSNSLRILYIDDDIDDLEFMQEGLRQVAPQHTLHCVRNADSFVAEVKKFQPDLIFLDYNMPLCDGKDCLQAIQADPELNNIPIVMYCTSSSANTLNECYALGAVRYLLKPVDYAGIIKGLHLIFHLHYEGRLIRSEFEDFFIDTYKLN